MKKIKLLLFFLIYVHSIYSQATLKTFHISTANLLEVGSKQLLKCKTLKCTDGLASIRAFKQDSLILNNEIRISNISQWNDSILFSIEIAKQVFDNSDSILIKPSFKFACVEKEADGTPRGTKFLEIRGDEKATKAIQVKFQSNPQGSVVYLIPKIAWERNPLLAKKDQEALRPFRIHGGLTPIWYTAHDYVYITLFKYKSNYSIIEFRANYNRPIDSVYAEIPIR